MKFELHILKKINALTYKNDERLETIRNKNDKFLTNLLYVGYIIAVVYALMQGRTVAQYSPEFLILKTSFEIVFLLKPALNFWKGSFKNDDRTLVVVDCILGGVLAANYLIKWIWHSIPLILGVILLFMAFFYLFYAAAVNHGLQRNEINEREEE